MTASLGAVLAWSLIPGDLVLLRGGLGSGKTAFARAVLRALGKDEALEVPSPTFSILQPYEFGNTRVLHADLYRLSGARDLEELGLFDDPEAIVLVEWPERSPALARQGTLEITFEAAPSDSTEYHPNHRQIGVTAVDKRRQTDLEAAIANNSGPPVMFEEERVQESATGARWSRTTGTDDPKTVTRFPS